MNDITYDEPVAEAPAGGPGDASYYYGEGFWMALFQGQIPKQNFYLLIASLMCVFGTLLPWYPVPETTNGVIAGEVLKGVDYMSGAVICFFALMASGVMIYNIRARALLFWPILLMLVDNLFILALHFLRTGKGFITPFTKDGEFVLKDAAWEAYRSQGIGIYFVTFATLFVLLQILLSVFMAAGKDKDKPKPAAGGGGGGAARRRR